MGEPLPLIVKLQEYTDKYEGLMKRIDESYLNENFGTLLGYILSATPDQLNPGGYTNDEKEFAQMLGDYYNINKKAEDYLENLRNKNGKDYPIDLRALASRKEIRMGDEIMLNAIDKNKSLIECPLDDIINEYSERIIKVENIEDTDYKYRFIDLIISRYCWD
ncbi:MAG: hypothetical protein U9R34_04130 [Nanoarchaeota archaeon]|nr:hypothetical protein [Nanoarchaeota archaeon]